MTRCRPNIQPLGGGASFSPQWCPVKWGCSNRWELRLWFRSYQRELHFCWRRHRRFCWMSHRCGSLAVLLHLNNGTSAATPTAFLESMVATACTPPVVTRLLSTHRHRRGLASLSPLAFAIVCEKLDDVLHTFYYLFSQDLHRPHRHPPSPHQYAIAGVHLSRVPLPPLPNVILPVPLSSFVFLPLL